MKQFISFLRKEFYHIFRDVRTMMILLAMPIILIILFGYAITTEIKRVPITILDHSRDEVTIKMTERLAASEYFDLYGMSANYGEVQDCFRTGKARVAIVFPARYASTPGSTVQVLADATDPNEATQLTTYVSAIIQSEWMAERRVAVEAASGAGLSGAAVTGEPSASVTAAAVPPPVITPVVHLLYNPQMKGAYNFVPGVMGLILMLICAMMTSVGIVREKETGTMEILLVSPMKPVYIILAKAVPYLLLSMVNIATILLLAYFLLEVPVNGSLALLVFVSILYSLVALCLGLLISTVAHTQQAAMLISGMALMLPIMLLSGMLFPTENMPLILQGLSYIVPAKWYIIAVKDIMIKGLGLAAIWREVGILLFMVVLLVSVSVKRFNVRLS